MLKKFNFLGCILLLWIYSSKVLAYEESIPFVHYNTVNGLPSSEVYVVTEDHRGYIWIGTDRGLTRFDGVEFKQYAKDNGLTDNVIFDIYESPDKVLWIMGYHKVFYSYDYEHFYAFPLNSIVYEKYAQSKAFFNVISATEDSLLLHTHKGTSLAFDKFGNYNFNPAKYQIDSSLEALLIHKTDPETFHSFSDFYAHYSNKSEAFNIIEYQIADSLQKVSKICKSYNTFLSYPSKLCYPVGDSICHYFPAPGGYLKITYFGFTENSHVYYIPYDSSPKIALEPLSNKYVVGTVIDKKNGLWVYTNKNGLFYYENMYLRQLLREESIVYLFEAKNHTISVNTKPRRRETIYLTPEDNGHLNYKTQTENVYDYELGPGSQSIRYKSNAFVMLSDKKSDQIGGRSMQFKDSTIYYTGSNGIYKVKAIPGNSERPNLLNVFPENLISFHVETDSNIWFGGLNGFYHLDGKTASKYHFKNGTINTRVEDIKKCYKTGLLFIATMGNGLYIASKDSIITCLNESNSPLGNNKINQLYLDGDSLLWIATTGGINKLDLKIKPYQLAAPCILGSSVSDRIQQIIAAKEYLYFVSTNNLFRLKKSNYHEISATKVPLILEELSVDGKRIPQVSDLQLEHDQNDIIIQFKAPAFGDVLSQLSYEYRFINQGSDWTKTTNNRLTFIDLPPQDYQLEIRAVSFEKEVSKERLLLRFSIQPPFWMTPWFITTTFLVLLLIIAIIVYSIFRRERIKNSAKQERAELKQKALRAQLNSHFIFNTLSAIQHSVAVNDVEKTTEQIKNFSSLLRKVFEQSDYPVFPLSEELKLIKKYVQVENFRFQRQIALQVNIENKDVLNALIPPLLLQPLIENAIQHGFLPKKSEEESYIRLTIFSKDNQLFIEIMDNGIGFNQALQHSINRNKLMGKESKGLKLVRQRLESLNQQKKPTQKADFHIEDLTQNNPKKNGTRVLITLSHLTA